MAYSTLTANDTIIMGDSGAGYLQPDGLFEPRMSGLPSGAQVWQDWNRHWYDRFDVQFSGFLIGANRNESYALYAGFSPFGASGSGLRLVSKCSSDLSSVTTFLKNGFCAGGMPVLPGPAVLQTELRGTVDPEQAAATIASWAREQAKAPTVPAFASWRVIIQPASVFAELARLSAADNLVFVSPLELGLLAKIHLAGAAEGGA